MAMVSFILFDIMPKKEQQDYERRLIAAYKQDQQALAAQKLELAVYHEQLKLLPGIYCHTRLVSYPTNRK
jgi:hypothetical protein